MSLTDRHLLIKQLKGTKDNSYDGKEFIAMRELDASFCYQDLGVRVPGHGIGITHSLPIKNCVTLGKFI